MLHQFYAVTTTSVYFVKWQRSNSDHIPIARKIALKGTSMVKVGDKLHGGSMIAITNVIQLYTPEGCGPTSPMTRFERDLRRVNTYYWAGRSSLIVALFTTKRKAMNCFNHWPNLEPFDKRWLKETRNVVTKIGESHPSFEICCMGQLSSEAA